MNNWINYLQKNDEYCIFLKINYKKNVILIECEHTSDQYDFRLIIVQYKNFDENISIIYIKFH